MSHHRFPLRAFQSRQSPQSYCLFVYLLWAFFGGICFVMVGRKEGKKQSKGVGDDKTRSKMVIQRGTWYGHTHTQTHTQTISLITSDREDAEGNSHSYGHFHCGAPLAVCPIYAFNTHTCTHSLKLKYSHTCISVQRGECTHTNTNKNMCTPIHKRTCEHRDREWKWNYMVGSVIIYAGNHVCGNGDKTYTFAPSLFHECMWTHTHWNNSKSWGDGLVSLLIGCVFWQANLKNRTLYAHQSPSIFMRRPHKCLFNDPGDIFTQSYNCLPYLFIFVSFWVTCCTCIAGLNTRMEILSWQANGAISLTNWTYDPF